MLFFFNHLFYVELTLIYFIIFELLFLVFAVTFIFIIQLFQVILLPIYLVCKNRNYTFLKPK